MNRPLLLSALALKHGSERTCARCNEPLMLEEDWPEGLCTWCHDDVSDDDDDDIEACAHCGDQAVVNAQGYCSLCVSGMERTNGD